MTTETKRIIDEATDFIPEPPRPLRRELPPAEPYPVEALGPMLSSAARAIHERIQAPLAICAQSCLATATLVVQAYCDVLMPYGQRRPISNFFMSIAYSGERKTSADSDALSPVREFEEALRAEGSSSLSHYEDGMALHEAERRRIVGDKDMTGDAKRKAIEALGAKPEPPLIPMLTCPEPTFEGLARLYAIGRPSLGVFSSEGGQFVGGFGMSREHRLMTASGLSSLWDGEPLRRVRAGDGSRVLAGRRLAVNLLLQPDVAAEILADRMLADQGLLSRVLAVAPESTMGTRSWREPSPDAETALSRYTDWLLTILRHPLPLRPSTANELLLRILELSPKARPLWISFSDHIERQLGPAGDLTSVRAFGAKAAEHAARLGAVLTLINDLDAGQLDEIHLAAGIELVQHYLSEWRRLHDAATTRPEIGNAEKLRNWLLTVWDQPYVGLPEVYQRGPNAIRDAKTAREAIDILEDHGWLFRVDGGTVVGGTFRRDAWQIIRG